VVDGIPAFEALGLLMSELLPKGSIWGLVSVYAAWEVGFAWGLVGEDVDAGAGCWVGY
jgi:hypothetical protein